MQLILLLTISFYSQKKGIYIISLRAKTFINTKLILMLFLRAPNMTWRI